ncbi:MAG: hypothetical protein OYM47_12175 [Gemmatimonadota bacterium]|nr:hypothetical protein [Gemmatimonadota bacterium]
MVWQITNRRLALLPLAVVAAAFNLPASGYAQVPVPAVQESITVSTSGTLTEEPLDGSEVTLTLSGRAFESSIFDVRDGVTISGTPQRVTNLRLWNEGLNGTIPAGLSRLTGLKALYLAFYQLTGTIAEELGNASSRLEMRLDDNMLTGSIPSSFSNLTRLVVLHLAGNTLTGCIPPSLRDVSVNDMDELNLPDCSQTQGQKTADFNGAGTVNFADFFEFVDAFVTSGLSGLVSFE